MNKKIDPKKIKALAIDLDGTTLLPEAVLGERTRKCLRALISKGMQIIIATGRATVSAEKYRSAIGAEGPMVYFNGAEVVNFPSGKALYTNMIGMDVVDFAAEIARSLGIYFQVYLPEGTLIAEKYGPEAEYYFKHTGINPVVKDFKKIAAMPDVQGCIKGMFIADPSFHDEIRKKIFERFGDSITVMRSYPTFLEVINNGVSKGEGLKIAMQHSGLKPEEVIAFGDEENDLPMFTVAGFSAAPRSAREKIREAADIIYGSHAEEGLAVYLEENFL